MYVGIEVEAKISRKSAEILERRSQKGTQQTSTDCWKRQSKEK
jgi:hypothetical protein